jgi:hypothetical protein
MDVRVVDDRVDPLDVRRILDRDLLKEVDPPGDRLSGVRSGQGLPAGRPEGTEDVALPRRPRSISWVARGVGWASRAGSTRASS